MTDPTAGPRPGGPRGASDVHLHVLARGARWAIVAKPARLACHRSAMIRERVTLADAARYRFRTNVHLVHRLDRGVSGCLLIAFDPEAAALLHAALKAPETRKTYLVMVRGAFDRPGPIVVETPMKDSEGVLRDARSTVWPLGLSDEPRCSLLRVEPDTGRYHQVRRHVRDLNHPALGDGHHGDSRENKRWRAEHGLMRVALHCHRLALPADALPGEGPIVAVCPPPVDLVRLWRVMPWWDEAVALWPDLTLPPLDLDAALE